METHISFNFSSTASSVCTNVNVRRDEDDEGEEDEDETCPSCASIDAPLRASSRSLSILTPLAMSESLADKYCTCFYIGIDRLTQVGDQIVASARRAEPIAAD